jgi:hypothetical protein
MAGKLAKIQNMIYEIRGQKVMLDYDLAELYAVELKALNQTVKRNIERFPSDFMFKLTQKEWNILRSQIVTANRDISKVRFSPYVFTKDIRIEELHRLLMLHIENNDYKFSKHDKAIKQIVQVLNNLMEQPRKTGKIGFHTE